MFFPAIVICLHCSHDRGLNGGSYFLHMGPRKHFVSDEVPTIMGVSKVAEKGGGIILKGCSFQTYNFKRKQGLPPSPSFSCKTYCRCPCPQSRPTVLERGFVEPLRKGILGVRKTLPAIIFFLNMIWGIELSPVRPWHIHSSGRKRNLQKNTSFHSSPFLLLVNTFAVHPLPLFLHCLASPITSASPKRVCLPRLAVSFFSL